MSRRRQFIMVTLAGCAIGAAGTQVAQALEGDSDDGIGATVDSHLKSNTSLELQGVVISGLPYGITCRSADVSNVQLTDTLPAGLTLVSLPPSFNGCTDTLGGTDTVSASGTFSTTLVDAVNDETGEMPRDGLALNIPTAGLTITSTVLPPGCTITLAPSGPAAVTGAYNDKGSWKWSNATIPYGLSSSCPGGAATGIGTFSTVLTSGATGIPGIMVSPAIYDVS